MVVITFKGGKIMAYEIKDFQHESDSSTISQIFSNSVAQSVINTLKATNMEEVYKYLYESSCPQLTEKNSPKLYLELNRACEMFGLNTLPKIFITRNYTQMVSVLGISNPFILFSSEYLKKLNGEMLFGILSGQVAAIRCEHNKIIYIIWALEFASSFIPFSTLILEPLINNWKRCRFFTYDRAFSLATKSRRLSLKQILLNVVPKNILDKMSLGTEKDVFATQANHFINDMNQTQTGIKTAIEMFSEKDWLPMRYAEVNKFFDERRYE